MWVARTVDERPSALGIWLSSQKKEDVIQALILREVDSQKNSFKRI